MTQLTHAKNLVKNLVSLIKILEKKLKMTTFDHFVVITRNVARKKRVKAGEGFAKR